VEHVLHGHLQGRGPLPGDDYADGGSGLLLERPDGAYDGNFETSLDTPLAALKEAMERLWEMEGLCEIIIRCTVQTGPAVITSDHSAKIVLSNNGNATLQLVGQGSLITVGAGRSLEIQGNLVLKGHPDNNAALVTVNGGSLTLTDTFNIDGNRIGRPPIMDNNVGGYGSGNGGGVAVNSGNIRSNSAAFGGGVYVEGQGNVTLVNSTISNNNAGMGASGVYVASSTFTNNGTVSGNTPNDVVRE
jgi:hypothetical protein